MENKMAVMDIRLLGLEAKFFKSADVLPLLLGGSSLPPGASVFRALEGPTEEKKGRRSPTGSYIGLKGKLSNNYSWARTNLDQPHLSNQWHLSSILPKFLLL